MLRHMPHTLRAGGRSIQTRYRRRVKPELFDDATVERFAYGGAEIVAERHGAGERTFVLVHGIGMGRSVFADAAGLLAQHGGVIAIDLPGYGEAPEPPRPLTIERTADLVAAFLSARVRGPIVLVGHSMGTQVATEIAVRHPGVAECIVLVAPTVDAEFRTTWRQFARLMSDLVNENPKVIFAGAREYVRAGPNLGRKMRAMLVHRPEEAYPRVTVPALVLRGADDRVSTRKWCERVADALPEGRLEEVPDRGHETMIRDAAPVVARILAFLGPT